MKPEKNLVNKMRGGVDLLDFKHSNRDAISSALDHALRQGMAQLYATFDTYPHPYQFLPSVDDLAYFDINCGMDGLKIWHGEQRVITIIGQFSIATMQQMILRNLEEIGVTDCDIQDHPA